MARVLAQNVKSLFDVWSSAKMFPSFWPIPGVDLYRVPEESHLRWAMSDLYSFRGSIQQGSPSVFCRPINHTFQAPALGFLSINRQVMQTQ